MTSIRQHTGKDIIYQYSGGRNRPGKMMSCVTCGKVRWVSISNISRSKYCQDCRKHPPYNSHEIKCIACGKIFRLRKSQHKNKCCSYKCRKSLFLTERRCSWCGNEFQPRNSGSVFCSRKCFYESRKIRVVKICETCGNTFDVQPNRIDARYCSKSCQKRKGIENPNYRNGKYLDNNKPYPYGGKWPSIRKWIKERDNNKCQYPGCNEVNKLQIHHIIRFEDFTTKEAANIPENLITYCIKHHQSFHSIKRKTASR